MLDKSHSINIDPPYKPYSGVVPVCIALTGLPNSGKTTLFNDVASTTVLSGQSQNTGLAYTWCKVQLGLDNVDLIDLPSISTLQQLREDQLDLLKYLLWGNRLPQICTTESNAMPLPFSQPDIIIQVIDATALERHLELTLELTQIGKPMVIALNMMDQARQKGLHINVKILSRLLGVPIVPITATMGHGIANLFDVAIRHARSKARTKAHAMSPHLQESLQKLKSELDQAAIVHAFHVAPDFLLTCIAAGDLYFTNKLKQYFPEQTPQLMTLRDSAELELPRPLKDELHADRHHRAATLYETVTRIGPPNPDGGWRYWLDELFLDPRWGILGSLTVFALVLFVVFEISAWLDAMTAAKLVAWTAAWQPTETGGVIARAISDGLIGLVGIVIPYMIPLVMLLVSLEESGIMHRIAFVVDRWFHYLGLHGGVAIPFLLGLGCNVPALSATAGVTEGRQRIIASVLITFVPCSARSAVILALAGKYLGGLGVFAIFMTTLIVIAIMGQLMTRYFQDTGPGQIQEIPAYALPQWHTMLRTTWNRTRDILTIVTPLLVGGSVVLALLGHFGADQVINTALTPITVWWLGLPIVLGVPIVFGILRKELSLLMIYQALGSFDVGNYMDWVQMMTFLVFLTFYFPCVSTFAVMLKTIGRNNALISVSLSITVALIVSGIVRIILLATQYLLQQ